MIKSHRKTKKERKNNRTMNTPHTDNYRRFTVWAETWEELEAAADLVDEMQEQGGGHNAIYYQLIPNNYPGGIFDIGFITDKALKELEQRFLICPEM